MADLFDVIADSTRRDLLRVLLEKQRSGGSSGASAEPEGARVGELVETLGLSQPTVSKQLRVLRESGLVVVREIGQRRYYRLEAGPLEAIEDWVIPFLSSGSEAGSEAGSHAGAGSPAGALQHSSEAGESLGRAVAGVSHHARTAIGEASAGVQIRVIDPLRKRLTK